MRVKFLNSKRLNSNKQRQNVMKTFLLGKIRKSLKKKIKATKLKLGKKLIKLEKTQTKDQSDPSIQKHPHFNLLLATRIM